jgi:hypothetical protein
MRRALSILLILSFGLGPLAATLGASEDARLPACCRRHGAHHCAMSMGMAATMAEASSGETMVRPPLTCSNFPGATAAIRGPHALASTPMSLLVLLAQPHSSAAGRAIARLSQIRTRSGRAPPLSLTA